MINYVELIGEYYPGTEVSCAGDTSVYSNIVWNGTPISQAELDAVYLTKYKTDKIIEFSEYARDDIIQGFESNALGYPHFYDSEPEDQLNLIGAVATDTTMPYACKAASQGTQVVNFGGVIVEGNSTGLANNTSVYNCEVQLNSTSTYLSVVGNTAQTFTDLINVINADADFSTHGIASIENGDIVIKSLLFGSTSTVNIIDVSLFNSLTGYVGIDTAVTGIDSSSGTKEYKNHTHNELLSVINDGAAVKLTALQKFNVKREQIYMAADIAAVDAIVWE